MAYKKYIQKNGKLYGPYIYHSKRVDGKVVSEYYGTEGANKTKKYVKISLLFAGALLLGILIYFLAFSNNKLTGGVVLGVDTSYEKGKPLNGVLKFSLTEGELIPDSSKVVFENSGKTYEFALKDVLDEPTSEGNYYISGRDIQGNGAGYGIEGEKIDYPDIEFVLQVYTESTEPIQEEPTEQPQEEETPSESTPEETTTETNQEVTPAEASTEITPSESKEKNSETDKDKSNKKESSPSPITGNQIKSSGGIFASFFGMTGMVSMELVQEIDGVTSKDKPSTYELKEGESVELKPKSVKMNGEEVGDNVISLKIEGNEATVTTDYSEKDKGYGEDYKGDKEKTISVDLSDLNLVLEEGDLNIKLVYGEEEILSLTTVLAEGEKTSDEVVIGVEENQPPVETPETPEEIPVEVKKENKTFAEENQTVEEVVNTSLWEIGDFLTQAERKILMDNFGKISLESTKSELYNGRIIRGYSFDKYSVEYSYDPSLTKELLEVQMDRDRIKFLKDIASSVSKEKSVPEKLEGYNQTYTP
jgi:hypothetical protein